MCAVRSLPLFSLHAAPFVAGPSYSHSIFPSALLSSKLSPLCFFFSLKEYHQTFNILPKQCFASQPFSTGAGFIKQPRIFEVERLLNAKRFLGEEMRIPRDVIYSGPLRISIFLLKSFSWISLFTGVFAVPFFIM